MNGHVHDSQKNITMLVSSKCCAQNESFSQQMKILLTSWLFTLSSAFLLLFGFLLVEWVVQLCQWHLSRSCAQTSPLPPYTFLWPSGASVSRLWEHVANSSWQWLQPAPGHRVPAQLWCLHIAVWEDKRTCLLKKRCAYCEGRQMYKHFQRIDSWRGRRTDRWHRKAAIGSYIVNGWTIEAGRQTGWQCGDSFNFHTVNLLIY